MTFSYKVRVLALLLSLVHSSYGALFARPPPEATYCKPGTCTVFHSPINTSHTICMWVQKGTNVTHHVDNVNPDEICPSEGRGGFPDDINGTWGGNGNRDSFCAALEVFKTNMSNLNGNNAIDYEIRCTQTNAYFCTVKKGCPHDLTLATHHNKKFTGWFGGVDFSRTGYPLNPNVFSPTNIPDDHLSLGKRWQKYWSNSSVPAGEAKDTSSKKDGDKGTDSKATADGEGAATSNTNQWLWLPREFYQDIISPIFGKFSEHMPDVDTVRPIFSWIYTSVTDFFEQLVTQQFREFITKLYYTVSLYSTRNEMQVTTFFMFIWGMFSLGRYFTACHSKFTKVTFGSKHFITKGKLQNIMITKKEKDGIRTILCMCKVIHDDVSDVAEVAGRWYNHIPVLVHPLETCTWNWIWYEWKLFLPYLITYPLIGFGWSFLFLGMLHKVFGWKLIVTVLGVISAAMTGSLAGSVSLWCVILLVWSFLRTIFWNLLCILWTWLKQLCNTTIIPDTPLALHDKAQGLFLDMTCICKQYMYTSPGRFIFDTSTSVIRIFGYPEVWLFWFVGTLLFPTNLHSQMIPVALGQTEEWEALRVTYIPNPDSYHYMTASGKCGTSPKSMPYVLELCMCICMFLNYRKYHITPSSAICIVDCCFVLFHGVLCIYIPWSFFGSSFVSTVFLKYSNPFVFFGTIATGMGQMTQDLLLRSFLPNFILVKELHSWWLNPVATLATFCFNPLNMMATLCFWHSIPEFWCLTSVVVIGVCLWLQLPKDANARHIYFDAFWKVINPINHHGAMARIVLFIMVIQIMVRLYPIAVVQEWVNAPDMCLEYETIDKISKKQGFSEYIISIMNLSRYLCMLHTAAQTYFYFKPTNFKIKRETISKVTIKGVAHVFEGTMQFRWTSMCAKNDLHRLYLCLLSFMIWLGWWLWPGPEADESDWYTAHLKMYIYGPLEYILVCLCECVWKDKSLIEKPEFSLMLQVLAFVCCLWLLYFADIKSSPCTHTTFQTNSSKQIAVAINNGILDIWGVVFNSIMSEDVPSAYEHREHGVAMTFDVSEGIYELVPHGAEVAWTSYDRVEIFGGPGLNDALYGSRTRESDAAKKHGLKARGRGLTAAEKK